MTSKRATCSLVLAKGPSLAVARHADLAQSWRPRRDQSAPLKSQTLGPRSRQAASASRPGARSRLLEAPPWPRRSTSNADRNGIGMPVYRFELAGDPHLHLMPAALAALRSDLSVAAVPPQALTTFCS